MALAFSSHTHHCRCHYQWGCQYPYGPYWLIERPRWAPLWFVGSDFFSPYQGTCYTFFQCQSSVNALGVPKASTFVWVHLKYFTIVQILDRSVFMVGMANVFFVEMFNVCAKHLTCGTYPLSLTPTCSLHCLRQWAVSFWVAQYSSQSQFFSQLISQIVTSMRVIAQLHFQYCVFHNPVICDVVKCRSSIILYSSRCPAICCDCNQPLLVQFFLQLYSSCLVQAWNEFVREILAWRNMKWKWLYIFIRHYPTNPPDSRVFPNFPCTPHMFLSLGSQNVSKQMTCTLFQ